MKLLGVSALIRAIRASKALLLLIRLLPTTITNMLGTRLEQALFERDRVPLRPEPA
jgi:hypothetical protein